MDVRTKNFKEYRNALEQVLLQDERMSAYNIRVILECIDHSYNLGLREATEAEKVIKKNNKIGLDVSSIL
jgi:hypothetical protein